MYNLLTADNDSCPDKMDTLKQDMKNLKTSVIDSIEAVSNKMDECLSSIENQCMYICMSVDHYT